MPRDLKRHARQSCPHCCAPSVVTGRGTHCTSSEVQPRLSPHAYDIVLRGSVEKITSSIQLLINHRIPPIARYRSSQLGRS